MEEVLQGNKVSCPYLSGKAPRVQTWALQPTTLLSCEMPIPRDWASHLPLTALRDKEDPRFNFKVSQKMSV